MSLPRTWVQTLQYFAEGVATEQRVSEGDIPTPDQFAAFVNMGLCPFEARLEAAVRLNRLLAVMGVVETPGLPKEVKEWLEDLDDGALLELIPDRKFIVISRITTDGILEGESRESESRESEEFRLSVLELENTRRQIFSKYLALSVPGDEKHHSFLVPLMEAWVKHPELRPVEPERRQQRIMPEPIRYAVSQRRCAAYTHRKRTPRVWPAAPRDSLPARTGAAARGSSASAAPPSGEGLNCRGGCPNHSEALVRFSDRLTP